MTTEEELTKLLAAGGGKLSSYVVRGAHIEMSWQSRSGKPYVSSVRRGSYDVVCAGFCLDGEDTKFHLKDLPYIAEMGEEEDAIFTVTSRDIDYEGLEALDE